MNSPFHWVEFNIFCVGRGGAGFVFCFHRRPHKIGLREALLWSGVWIGAARFCLRQESTTTAAHKPALEFSTGYLIENR